MRFLLVIIYLFFLALNSSCSWWKSETPNANANANANVAKDETVTTPPFTTREPETFQAKMVVTASLGEKLPSPPPQEFFVQRAGDKRRVEFENGLGEKVALLQTSSGQIALNLTKKEYTEIKLGSLKSPQNGNEPNPLPQTGNPLEGMLNQIRTGAKYEKLGQEEVNGRMTAKYRVSSQQAVNATGQPEQVLTESLIWIDESLGMPIKSETTYTGQNARNVRYTMEVRDIKLEAPPASAFEIPKGFKKVED